MPQRRTKKGKRNFSRQQKCASKLNKKKKKNKPNGQRRRPQCTELGWQPNRSRYELDEQSQSILVSDNETDWYDVEFKWLSLSDLEITNLELIFEDFLKRNPMYSFWEVARETDSQIHDIWKVLQHEYRSVSQDVGHQRAYCFAVDFEVALLALGVLDTAWESSESLGWAYCEMIHRANGMHFEAFINAIAASGAEHDKMRSVVALAQYGDFIRFTGVPFDGSSIAGCVLGYGPSEQNLDPTNLYMMTITAELSDEDEFTAILPHEFADAPLRYFDPVIGSCRGFASTIDICELMCENNTFELLSREMKNELCEPEYSPGKNSNFPDGYVARVDEHRNGPVDVSWKPIGLIHCEDVHTKRIQYAVACRTQIIYALLMEEAELFTADIIHLLMEFLL